MTEPALAFAPTRAAAMARLDAIDPERYAHTRNHLDGAVTRLSPYITHGFLTLPQVLQAVRQRHPVHAEHRFVYELGWREYFRHVHRRLGDGIFESLHPGVLPDAAYSRELPADIRHAATGIATIDRAVRELYATGWLHNHARMWLASYTVHLRKAHWRAGADWMFGHLLDGDLASNHLSWQWVAGTSSSKPYLFNADNVARFAGPGWGCRGTVLDTGYAELERIARSEQPAAAPGGPGIDEPALWPTPPGWQAGSAPAAPVGDSDSTWLVHPWALGPVPAGRSARAVFDPAFHARWPWSARRWAFVVARQTELAGAGAVVAMPFVPSEPPALFTEPSRVCTSFSAWWRSVRLLQP